MSQENRSPVTIWELHPGATDLDANLITRFAETRASRGGSYQPRTRHLEPDGWARYTNRLFLETSPYLLQHAHNPVNWYPWGDEAFEAARRQNRPVLISIGYSTCHWCHVMEEESYEDEEIARYLNENYIAIKVDREERPDVDTIYMSAVQVMTGSGGWPLHVFLTPERKPFFGGTYFPARDGDRGVSIGFLTILKRINDAYHSRRDRVEQSSRQLTEAVRGILLPKQGERRSWIEVMRRAADQYRRIFDTVHGGTTGAPKFPSSLSVRFLLRFHRDTEHSDLLQMTNLTLEKMAAGGMYDHVAGGFHRYSTDAQWLVPHFEKMLYDNALLAVSYLEAFQATGNRDFQRVTEEILHYVARDMTSPEGGFYSATDADSLNPDGCREEGYYFTWTLRELVDALGGERTKIVKAYYAIGRTGNFEGRHILHTPKTDDEVAKSLKITKRKLRFEIDRSKKILYRVRNRRPLPLRDEKILTAWNGLMISAFAKAGLVLGDSDYVAYAVRAARFILEQLYADRRLFRSYKDGKAGHNAYLTDYAFFIAALLDLYEATYDGSWLEIAIVLDGILEKHYEDKKKGGFFMTSLDHENLIARPKPHNDGALPNGNSTAYLNLLRLGKFTTNDAYRQRIEKGLSFFESTLVSNTLSFAEMLLAVDFHLDDPPEIILVTSEGKEREAEPFLAEFRKRFLPNRILVVVGEGEAIRTLARFVPLVEGKTAIRGKATAYVCKKGICEQPTTDPAVFAVHIGRIKKRY
ncbi:MAG: thioredoxin domain-containing protein [Proteobacteria bacterium]|nr:thioredoxin domain-containing protein [Pseudomonadota bacterium]